jgi:hypothetical protein
LPFIDVAAAGDLFREIGRRIVQQNGVPLLHPGDPQPEPIAVDLLDEGRRDPRRPSVNHIAPLVGSLPRLHD